MLKYYDFSGVSFLVEKSFECENASENAAARFVQPGTLIYTYYNLIQYIRTVGVFPREGLYFET